MKRTVLCFITALLALTAILFSGCDNEKSDGYDYSVKVMLSGNELLTVDGENTVSVKAGESAVFDVTVPEGMTVSDLSSGAYYKNGKIVLESVYFPVTLKYNVREAEYYTFTTKATRNGGVSKAENVKVSEDDEVVLKAYPNEGAIFAGWSYGKPLTDGGEYISSECELVFNVTQNGYIYGNFINEENVLFRYNANGGTVAETGNDEYVTVTEDDYHIYANTLPDTGIFQKDGSVLIGYNTKQDGSGEFYGLGWNVTTEENITELYCVWSEMTYASEFEYILGGKNLKITKYLGNEKTVTVPEYINGKKVTVIGKGAFYGKDTETVILPRSISKIEDGAFEKCKLQTLYLPDGVYSVGDGSFLGCENFSKLIVNAVGMPKFQLTDNGTYAIKYERLVYANRNSLPMLVFTSGSNGTYGINSAQLEKGLGNKYYIVDYSQHCYTSGCFFLDLISSLIKEDDILLYLPEPFINQMGGREWNSIMWQIFEGAYDCIVNVDIRDYSGVFNSFAEYNLTRRYMSDTEYTDHLSIIDGYGGNSWYRAGEGVNFRNDQVYDLNTDFIKADSINEMLDKSLEKGAKVYFSYPSLNVNGLIGKATKTTHRNKYENYIKENLHATVISELDDYIFKAYYMSGTNYHLSTEGTAIRTERLIGDINAQLKKEINKQS